MSASNYRFEIAVAVPLANNSFKFPNRFSAVIGSISGTTLPLTDVSTESDEAILHASAIMKVGDRLTLKSASGAVGTTLVATVPSTGTSITSVTNMESLGFATNDTVVGYGTVCPGGWYFSSYLPESGYTFSIEEGHVDGFCASMYLPASGGTGTARGFYLKQSIHTDYYVQNLNYRIGGVYKATISGAQTLCSGLFLGIENNTIYDDMTMHATSSLSNVTTWTCVSSSVCLTQDSPTAFGIYAELYTNPDYSVRATTIYLDDVFLEHVYNPVTKKTIYGESPSTASTADSYYEIADNHDSESLSITKLDNLSDISLNDGSLARYDSTGLGERNVKYEISCRFTNVSNTIWNYLSKLLDIQKNGYKLNLHPYIAELPEVLTGYLYISGISYTHWDVGLVSFDFRFREA